MPKKAQADVRILHILDHSLPLHSGYTFRTLSILRAQRALGWETFHLTSEKQTGCTVQQENVDGWDFYRTAPATGLPSRLPVFNQLALMRGLEQRLDEVVREVRPDILHAHSPVLNALPAIRIGKHATLEEWSSFSSDLSFDRGAFSVIAHGGGEKTGLRRGAGYESRCRWRHLRASG